MAEEQTTNPYALDSAPPSGAALIQALREQGDAASLQEAERMQGLYHDGQMARLADDVYDAAKDEGKPPRGWLRASEHLDTLHKGAPQLAGMSDERLLGLLQPRQSGFRAELYLPDPEVLGPGYKPVVAFKGSAGEVLDASAPGGKRDTTMEDFLANNFPQSVGLKTDYYDRAMQLASQLDKTGFDFELSGHSLGGGMSSAAAAVTGKHATNFNPAGLHPETAKRFAQENLGVSVHPNTNDFITAYLVQGELLNDGIQQNIHRLDAVRRTQLGGVLKEGSELLKELPEGRALLTRELNQQLPSHARDAVRGFVDRLAEGDTAQLLRELPLAAGQVQPILEAKTRRDLADPNGPVIDRAQELSLRETSNLAGPILTTLHVATTGAHVGRSAGQTVAVQGALASEVMDRSGDLARHSTQAAGEMAGGVVRTAGVVATAQVQMAGETVARARTAAAEAEARLDQAQGWVQHEGGKVAGAALETAGKHLPGGIGDWLEREGSQLRQSGEQAHQRNVAEAARARQDGREDAQVVRTVARESADGTVRVAAQVALAGTEAVAAPGRVWDAGLDAVGEGTRSVSGRAPLIGATAGVIVAGGAVAGVQYNPLDPTDYPNLVKAAAFKQHVMPSVQEATQRHLMTETVVPSLDARIEAVEQQARQRLHDLPASTQAVPQAGARGPMVPAPGVSFHAGGMQAAQPPEPVSAALSPGPVQDQDAARTAQLAQSHLLMAQQRQAQMARKADGWDADEREAGERGPGQTTIDGLAPASQRLAFSNPGHARHDLYQDLCGRLDAKDQLAGLSQDRLNQMTGELHQQGFQAGGTWSAVVVVGERFYAQQLDITRSGERVSLDLAQPAPTAQQTMAQVADFDRQQTVEAQQRVAQQQAAPQAAMTM